jgi:MFS family permease
MNGLHRGWLIVGVGALTTCIAFGTLLSLPVFLAPMAADTGWTRGGIAFGITLSFLVMGFASFVWGALSDRYGPRGVLLAGVALLAVGWAGVSRATSLLEFQLLYGIVIGAASGSVMAPLMATVTLWFDERRALAVSLVSAGIAVAPMTVSPLATWMMQTYGWRETQLGFAVVIAVTLLPAVALVRRPPGFEAPAPGSAGSQELKAAARRAFRSRAFIVMALTFFACCATHAGPIFHTVSYALGCGLSTMAAVTIYSVEGFAGLIGRLVFGVLADRVGVKRMIVAGLLVQAVAAGSYVMASKLGEFYGVAFVFGLAYGGVMPLYSALARSYFEPQVMGTVLGALTIASSLGMALGPAVGGWIFDTLHSYAWMYLGSLGVGLGAVAIALVLPSVRAPKAVPAAA